jgi:hypothetical protein
MRGAPGVLRSQPRQANASNDASCHGKYEGMRPAGGVEGGSSWAGRSPITTIAVVVAGAPSAAAMVSRVFSFEGKLKEPP